MKSLNRLFLFIFFIGTLGSFYPDNTKAAAVFSNVTSPDEQKPLSSNQWEIDFVGHIGGTTEAVTVQNNYAYIGEGPVLRILDISTPTSPIVLGKSLPMPEIIVHIVVADQYAYIADNDGGLRIIDVSSPTNPVEVGFFETPYEAIDLDVSGNYVYLVEKYYGIWVLDVSDPTNPYEVSFYDMHLSPVFEVKVVGNYAYIAHGGSGLRVIDITDPTNLVEVGHLDDYYYILSIAVSGDYAYLADGATPDAGLRVVDISDPTSPVEVGHCDTDPQNAHFVAISEPYAFLITDDGTYMCDISDPTSPVKSRLNSSIYGPEVALSGGYAYLAKNYYGLRVLDLADPQNLSEIGSYQTLGAAGSSVAAGNYLYAAGRSTGLMVLDISNPFMPLEIGHYDTSYAASIALAGNYAYIAGGVYGLRVIDVSNPIAPLEVATLDTSGYASKVTIAENYAYVVDGNGGLRIIDITSPTNPVEVGVYNYYTYDAEIYGVYAYVACGTSGLRVVDISSPSNPVEIGFYTVAAIYEVTVSAGYAYTVGSGYMRILDITNPSNPFEVGSYEAAYSMNHITVFENYAYLADSSHGLRVVDFSNPTHPIEVAYYRLPDGISDISISLDHIFVSDSWGGLFILHFVSPLADTGFRPDIHGYQFENYGGINFNDYSIASLRRIFGDDAVCWVMNGSLCIPDPRALDWLIKTSLKNQGGRCYGLSVTSLRFFTGIDSYPWIDSVYALEKSSDVTITWKNKAFMATASENIAFFHFMQSIGPVTTSLFEAAGKLPGEVLSDLLQAMTTGWNDPMILILVSGRQGHAVAPYAITNPSGDIYRVYVYDNEHPGDQNRFVAFDVANQTWRYDTGFGTWNGGPEAYSIAAVPISVNDQTMLCPWCENTLQSSSVMQTLVLNGEGRLIITDSQGRRLGYIGDQYFSEIPQGFGLVPILGTRVGSEPSYTLPVTETYTILLDGQTVTQTSTTSLSQFGPGYAVSVEDIIVSPETHDQLSIANSGEQVFYVANQTQAPNITLVLSGQDASYELAIQGVDVDAGEIVQLNADSSTGDLILDGSQISGGEYALSIGKTNATGLNTFFHVSIPMLGTDTHIINFGNWDGSGVVVMEIDHQSDGTIDVVVELENQNYRRVFLPLNLRDG